MYISEERNTLQESFNGNVQSELATWTFLDTEWLYQSNKEQSNHRQVPLQLVSQ